MVKARNKNTTAIFTRWFSLICLVSLSNQLSYCQALLFGNEFLRISDGTPAPKGRFPYMCSIRKRGSRDHACGGMLVASKWLLTAAHCLDPSISTSTGRSPLVYCGIHSREDRDTSKTYGTTRCYLHHLWTGRAFDGNDIALCELDRASSLPIPDLATAGDAFGRLDKFSVLGWGRTETMALADVLQIGSDLKFVPDSMCNRIEGWRGQLKESMICAGFDDPNTCRGDSGGPLLVPDEFSGQVEKGDSSRDLIVGITSFGHPSCDESIPGVYTRVSCYRTWINCIIGGTGEDCSVHVPCEEPPFGCSGAAKSARFNRTAAIETIRGAIETDDAATVERIICEGLNPNTTTGFLLSETLIEIAARNDAVESAKVLLRYGAAIEGYFFNPFGFGLRLNYDTPLHYAARYDSAGVAEVLIKNGANINAIELLSGYTPLMRAVVAKKLNTVQTLLRNGADLQIRASNRYAALHLAARYNVPEIAKALINAGVDIENAIPQKPLPPPPSPRPSLRLNFTFNPSFSFLPFLLPWPAYSTNVEDEDDGGWTSLHVTASYDSSDVTKVLLDSGAKIESKTDRGSAALHIAAMSGATDVAKILIDRGADINSEGKSDWTPFHFAAQNNSLTTAKALEVAGAKKEARSTSGYDPLMIASYHGSLSVVEFLLDEFVTSNSANNRGNTPLHLAASRGHISVVKVLLDDGASKLRTDNDGDTPYDEICSRLAKSECTSQTKSTLQGLLRTN